MDKNRFDTNSGAFVICMVCLLLSLILVTFSLYLLPFLIWQWNYDIPEYIFTLHQWMIYHYAIRDRSVDALIFLSFFIPGVLAGYISYRLSNKIDNEVLGLTPQATEPQKVFDGEEFKATVTFSIKMLVVVGMVIGAVFIFQWLISRT